MGVIMGSRLLEQAPLASMKSPVNLDKLMQTRDLMLNHRKWIVGTFWAVLVIAFVDHLGVIPVSYRLHSEICMEDLGCFSINGCYSQRPFNRLPQHRFDIDTSFILYKTNFESEEYHYYDLVSLSKAVDYNKNFIFLVHGWFTKRSEPIIVNLLKSLVETKSSSHNVIFVDWSYGSLQPYQLSASNVRVVGAELARVLQHLHNFAPVLSRTHLIGISLGAHISGHCGSLLPGIARITALDAASPLFENYPPSMRLDPSDASFVDAIHTDGDDFHRVILAEGGLGIHHPVGHADFYPHGGHTQPHCAHIFYDVFTGDNVFTLSLVRRLFACDHELSLEYFRRSLYEDYGDSFACHQSDEGFMKGLCHDANKMGAHAKKPLVPTTYYTQNLGFYYLLSIELDEPVIPPLPITYQLEGGRNIALELISSTPRQYNAKCTVHTGMLYSVTPIGKPLGITIEWKDGLFKSTSPGFRVVSLIVRNASVRMCSRTFYDIQRGASMYIPVHSNYCSDSVVKRQNETLAQCLP